MIILTLLLVSCITESFVSFHHLKFKKQRILLIGDLHQDFLDSFDNSAHLEPFNAALKEALLTYKKSPLCLLEMKEEFKPLYEGKPVTSSEYTVSHPTLKHHNHLAQGVFAFNDLMPVVPYDPRDATTTFLDCYMRQLIILLDRTKEAILVLKSFLQQLENYPHLARTSIGHLRSYFNQCEATIERLGTYHVDTPLHAIYLQQLEAYREQKRILELFFSGIAGTVNIEDAARFAIMECPSAEVALDQLISIRKQLDGDRLFADCVYLHQLISLAKKYGCIIFIAGANHTRHLSQFLLQANWECIDHQTLVTHFSPIQVADTSEFLPGLLATVDNFFKQSTPCVNKSCSCNFCFQSAPKQCTRCKIAHYCSTSCQKYDWPIHKYICTYHLKHL